MTIPCDSSSKSAKVCIAALATIVLLRLLTLPFPDLVDSTEGRYASIAKLMLDRNDWVTPWINLRGVEQPYLGKPPLHFWLMQLSFLLFGYGSFSARLPGVVSAIGIGWLLMRGACAYLGTTAGYVAALIFASSTMTFFLSGAAVLDMTLAFGVALASIGFLLADRSKVWGYLCFVGLGIGVLVKGPLAIVLPGMTIAPWLILLRASNHSWPKQLSSLPWFTGVPLFFAIVIPWYWLAELHSPGFLEYFFVNENFGRFLKKDYGDIYGVGHQQPRGAAWLMLVPALVPWSALLIVWIAFNWRTLRALFSRATVKTIIQDHVLLYAVLWAVGTPTLLMGARQYTGTYIVPAIPGFAFLGAVLWARYIEPVDKTRTFMLKACRGLTVLLSLITVVGIVLGFALYGSPLLLLPVTLAVSALYVVSLRINRNDSHLLKEMVRLAVCTVMTYSLASFAYNNHLSNNRSTRRLLTVAQSLAKPGAALRVGFPVYFPFSATFYGPLAQNPTLTIVNLEDNEIPGSDVDLMIVRNRNEDEFLSLAPAKRDQKLAEIGQWNIYRGTGENLK